MHTSLHLDTPSKTEATIPDFDDGEYLLHYVAVTDVGVKRTHNEDSCLALSRDDGSEVLLIVADGMGGYMGGDLASRLAVNALQEAFLKQHLDDSQDFERIFTQIDCDIRARLLAGNGGTTCVTALLDNDTVTVANIGDSRAYLYRDAALDRLTKDDSLVQTLVDAGRLTDAQAREYPRRNVIFKALGTGKEVTPTITHLRFMDGDLVILCSDGLCGFIDDQQLRETISEASELDNIEDLEQLCRTLISKAIETGSTDNITVACCQKSVVR